MRRCYTDRNRDGAGRNRPEADPWHVRPAARPPLRPHAPARRRVARQLAELYVIGYDKNIYRIKFNLISNVISDFNYVDDVGDVKYER